MNKLIMLFFSVILSGSLMGQCPGCVAYDCSAVNPDGGLCDTILIGMANHPIDQQISFYMPTQVYTDLLPGGGYVQLDRIEITGVTGLPLGLAWEANTSPDNEYFPGSGDTIGCVRMCGTPLQADTFPLTVYLLADVTAPVVGQVKNQSQTYDNAVVIILPDTAGGVSSFSIDPNISTSCDPLTLSFEANLDGAPNPTEYDWDFGNGNTATGKNPGTQTYSTPGTYPVTLKTTILDYRITQVRVFQVNGSYAGDIEELTTIQLPDLYFKIPTLGYQSSIATNSSSKTWSGLHIAVPTGMDSIEIEIWDSDNGPPLGSQDDFLGSAKLKLAVGTFLWNDDNGTNTEGLIVLGDTVGSVFQETLDITIGDIPEPTMSTDVDSICGGDTTTLVVADYNGGTLTWFKDSVLLPNYTDSILKVASTGTFWAEVISDVGCRGYTRQETISVFPVPPTPAFSFNMSNNQLFSTNATGVAQIQWYLDGQPIPGANSPTLNLTTIGDYSLEFANVLGCSKISDELSITTLSTGIAGNEGMMFNLYPNPTSGKFNVDMDVLTPNDLKIQILDNVGRLLKEENIQSFSGGLTRQYDLSRYNAGVYYVSIMSGESKIVKKILLFN